MRTKTLNKEAWGPWLVLNKPWLTWARIRLEVLDPSRKRVTEADDLVMERAEVSPEGHFLLSGPELAHTVFELTSLSVVLDQANRPVALEAVGSDGIRHVVRIAPPLALG